MGLQSVSLLAAIQYSRLLSCSPFANLFLLLECSQHCSHSLTPCSHQVTKELHKECGEKKPTKACRAMVMQLRDSLNIFGFSYFPVAGLKLKWKQMTRCVPYDRKLRIDDHTTNDPILVLMQYTQALFEALGDTEDAYNSKGTQHSRQRCIDVQTHIVQWLLELIHGNDIPGTHISWAQYMDQPGKQKYSISWRSLLPFHNPLSTWAASTSSAAPTTPYIPLQL